MHGPYITIRIDGNAGEADVNYTERFEVQNAIWRADVLQDILYDIGSKYEEAIKEAFPNACLEDENASQKN